MRDRQLGITERVSVNSDGVQGNGTSGSQVGNKVDISGDGNVVLFESGVEQLLARRVRDDHLLARSHHRS